MNAKRPWGLGEVLASAPLSTGSARYGNEPCADADISLPGLSQSSGTQGSQEELGSTTDASRSWCEGSRSTPARTVSRPHVIKIPADDRREKTRMFCTTCSLVQSKIPKLRYAVMKTKTKQNNKTTKQGGVLELRPAPMFSRAEPLFPY